MWPTFLIAGLSVYTWSLTQANTCTLPAKGSPRFPANFSIGVSTSSYQIEGGWNADGKGSSIWDDFTHRFPGHIADNSNGDVAADSYHRFDQDLEALKQLKVDHYRFSIAWTRIYPTGDISSKNQKGIDYYNMVIDKLLANGIEPMVTMFHFDLPLGLQMYGGFGNTLLIDHFVAYALELFKNFGDRVKYWITFNEPYMFCILSYGKGAFPPQVHAPGIVDYLCVDNILKAHALTYDAYRKRFYPTQRGRVGLSINTNFFFSKSNDPDIVDRGLQYNLGWLAHPIFSKSGGYPDVMVKDISKNSLREGRTGSRLPTLDRKWKRLLKGSADFLGLNYYTSSLIERAPEPRGENPSWKRDFDCDTFVDSQWPGEETIQIFCVPEGLEGLLKYIRDEYDNVEVIITENGWPDDGKLEDDGRILYLKSHLQAVLNAINDGCNVSAYTFWSLIDNFEWSNGYTKKFGLYAVDMTRENRERIPKKSATYFQKVAETRMIPI